MKTTLINKVRSAIARTVAGLAIGGLAISGIVISTPDVAQAASKTCRDLRVAGGGLGVIRPGMTVPVCYDGKRIWANGPTTGGVNTYGYTLNGITWKGTYNSGGRWLGTGMNYSVTVYGGMFTLSCDTRWMINARGEVFSYSRGC
jgi:hypothetical protein